MKTSFMVACIAGAFIGSATVLVAGPATNPRKGELVTGGRVVHGDVEGEFFGYVPKICVQDGPPPQNEPEHNPEMGWCCIVVYSGTQFKGESVRTWPSTGAVRKNSDPLPAGLCTNYDPPAIP
jgi:hypothetical protein